jgi:hypothetical protein
LSVSSARAISLPADASPEAIVDWCMATSDLLAFQTVVRRVTAEDWPDVCSRLARSLVESNAAPMDGSEGYAAERAARGRLAARFHKMQLLKAQDTARRPTIRARAAVAAEPDV